MRLSVAHGNRSIRGVVFPVVAASEPLVGYPVVCLVDFETRPLCDRRSDKRSEDAAMTNRPVRVLHVDDDPAMTRLTAQLLARHGIEVTPLHDPTAAVERIAAENFRIVIVDLQMPKLDGFELLERIKRADGGTAVIVLTGVVKQASVIRSLHEGATACFFKPLTDAAGLVDCIADINKSFDRWRETLRQLTQLRAGGDASSAAFLKFAASTR